MSVINFTHTSYTLDVRIFRISRMSVMNSTHTSYTLDVRIFRILRMSVINSTHKSYTLDIMSNSEKKYHQNRPLVGYMNDHPAFWKLFYLNSLEKLV